MIEAQLGAVYEIVNDYYTCTCDTAHNLYASSRTISCFIHPSLGSGASMDTTC